MASYTYDLLNVVEEATKSQINRLQVWAILCEDTGNNAIFIHSENPNGKPYPYGFENVVWGVPEPTEAKGLVNRNIHEFGKAKYEEEIVYYIRKKSLTR
ncbi:MAG TPA: hypothetical protein PK820_06370 [Candidatus Competibacteraceae bacterium]|nr:hypothetical protein [Candidatus Competibacteraceae bacterium]HPF58404.1 hypothetical protein [Candidatus Competibacteraceae bacterium]